MRIKMTKVCCGPGGSFGPGDERDVLSDEGRGLIAAGAAIDITPRVAEQATARPAEIADVPPAEVAAIDPPQRAVMHGKKGRGR